MRDMRDWMNSEFVSALDLLNDDGSDYDTVDLTIDHVSDPQPVECGPKKEECAVASFKGRDKRMILRNNHMKSLIKMFGPDADAMAGKKVRLWVEKDVNAFGTVRDCIRIKAAPKGRTKPLSTAPAPATEAPRPHQSDSLAEEEIKAELAATISRNAAFVALNAAKANRGISMEDIDTYGQREFNKPINELSPGQIGKVTAWVRSIVGATASPPPGGHSALGAELGASDEPHGDGLPSVGDVATEIGINKTTAKEVAKKLGIEIPDGVVASAKHFPPDRRHDAIMAAEDIARNRGDTS